MQAPYIPLRHIPLPKAQPPVATYNPQRQIATVANAYHVREVLKAAGYRWHEASKTWQRSNLSVEDFRTDYDLLHNVGVDLDAATANLLAEKSTALADAETITRVEIAPVSEPVAFSADVSSLTRARERIMRLAASGRIKDGQDLAELRAIAGLIKQALEVVA